MTRNAHVRMIERRVRVIWALLFLAVVFGGLFRYAVEHRSAAAQARASR